MSRIKVLIICVALFTLCVAVILITAARPARSYVDYIRSLGWETDDKTVNVSDIVIPKHWDSTMEQYNQLQLQAGYDLTPYKGKTAKLYSYAVLNYDGYDKAVYINLIIYNGSIIGGDISTPAIDGFMLPLRKRNEV